MKKIKPSALIILDGFGYREETNDNAIAQAHTPHFNELMQNFPTTLLAASGQAVGLPAGYAGNSEVGHLTIGTGDIHLQPFTIIENAINEHTFSRNIHLIEAFKTIQNNSGTLHIIGLLSDAAVHSHINHLFAFLDAAVQHALPKVVVHALLDGRDVAPQSASHYLSQLDQKIATMPNAFLSSLCGRFYGMDRNKNWELTHRYFSMLTSPQKISFSAWNEAIDHYYTEKITDEFIPPTPLQMFTPINPSDGVIFFNFRPDRARQLTDAFLGKAPFAQSPFSLSSFITPVSYGEQYPTTSLFKKDYVHHTLSKTLHDRGLSVFFIAETEKYAHITYFFNGGREQQFANEKWVLIPSFFAKDFETHPHMRAESITQAITESLTHNPHDFYVINYANADMVGHTGNFQATVKAIECLDQQIAHLYTEFVTKRNGTLYITGDHGKAEEMYDVKTHQKRTAHTTNPVFFIVVNKHLMHQTIDLPLTELADITPFIENTLET